MCRSLADRVKDADYWYSDLTEEVQDTISIFTRIDTELVLENHCIVSVQKMRRTTKIVLGLMVTQDDRTGWADLTIC